MIKAYYTAKANKWSESLEEAETFSTRAAAEKVRGTLNGMTEVRQYPGDGGNFVIVLIDPKRWWKK